MSAKPGSWRGGFCRHARAQPGVRCFHRVGCEKSGTAGCPPNMENGAGFGRRQKFEQPLFRQPRLFRSAVGAFFTKRRAAKRRKQIFLKPRLWRRSRSARFAAVRRCSRSARLSACGGALAPLGSPPALTACAQLFRRVPLPHLFFITDVRETGFMARGFLPPRKGAAGCALFSPCRL